MTSSTVEDINAFGGIAAVLNQNSNDANFSGSSRTDTNTCPAHSETITKDEFVVYSMNVRGLTNDDRLVELEQELDNLKNWDIIILTETWRKPNNEFFKTNNGNIFMNSGCKEGRRGVGFVIHRKWAAFIQNFEPLNERVAYLTMKIKHKEILVVGTYFPHSGYPDSAVEEVYDTIAKILEEGKKRQQRMIVAGDFNAEIGERNEFDDPRYVGKHSIGITNPRGAWLKRFCCFNSLTLASTLYPKPQERMVTYIGPNSRPRQIDFILVDQKTKRLIQDASSTQDLNMGSDHKAVQMKLQLDITLKPRRRKQRVEWHQVSPAAFKTNSERIILQRELPSAADETCRIIECTLLQAAEESVIRRSDETEERPLNAVDETLRGLIERRRIMMHRTCERTEISKQIQKTIRQLTRAKRRKQIKTKLDEFKNIKHIPRLKTRVKSRFITQMVDKHGKSQTNRMSIANIFATFYEELYSKRDAGRTRDDIGQTSSDDVSDFTEHELMKALKTLKNGKCKDTAGIRAEMLKNTGSSMRNVLMDLFNSILHGTLEAPKAWKHSVITVLYKNGDPSEPKNYRPICIIPLLYKLFSKLLYFRLYPILDQAQCPDQAGFRQEYSTIDHIFVFKMLQEKSEEY